jgi:hypothetical protein
MENIGSDVFRGSSDLLSVNLSIRRIDRGTTDAHPDFFQFYNPGSVVDNVIVYNTRVYDMGAQGIFGVEGTAHNVAFVNLLMEKDPPDSALTSQLSGDVDHLLLWHVTTVDSGFLLREISRVRNVWIQDGLWDQLSGANSVPAGFRIDHNRYAGLAWDMTTPLGAPASVGDPGFRAVSTDDYRLAPTSAALRAGVPLAGVPADVEGNLYDPTTPALGAFAN